jgi:hypothetical protein
MKALITQPPAAEPLAKHPWSRHPLARKLAIVTVIKVAGLFILWWAFFSGHGQRDMTPDQAADALLHHQFSNTTVGNKSK